MPAGRAQNTSYLGALNEIRANSSKPADAATETVETMTFEGPVERIMCVLSLRGVTLSMSPTVGEWASWVRPRNGMLKLKLKPDRTWTNVRLRTGGWVGLPGPESQRALTFKLNSATWSAKVQAHCKKGATGSGLA